MVSKKLESTDAELAILLADARAHGIRLEMLGGVSTWEMFPGTIHQETLMDIYHSIKKVESEEGECGCFRYIDLLIRFPDDSFKALDLSIFCTKPPRSDQACRQIPDAVIEIISLGYEAKDLEFGVPFYLANGIKDIVLVDPRTHDVHHFIGKKSHKLKSPVEITLTCGCLCTV